MTSTPIGRPIDLLRNDGEPIALTVAVVPVMETEDERVRNARAYVGEVRLNGHPVFGQRVLAHRDTPQEQIDRTAREHGVFAFACALQVVLGYDPSEHR